MEAEEGGEYRDSLESGFGFIIGALLIAGLTAWERRKETPPNSDKASIHERGTHV